MSAKEDKRDPKRPELHPITLRFNLCSLNRGWNPTLATEPGGSSAMQQSKSLRLPAVNTKTHQPKWKGKNQTEKNPARAPLTSAPPEASIFLVSQSLKNAPLKQGLLPAQGLPVRVCTSSGVRSNPQGFPEHLAGHSRCHTPVTRTVPSAGPAAGQRLQPFPPAHNVPTRQHQPVGNTPAPPRLTQNVVE